MNIHDILNLVFEHQGSDVHLLVGSRPVIRVEGNLLPIQQAPVLSADQAQALILPLMTQEQKNFVEVNKEVDFGYQYKDKGRFRVNVYHQKGTLAAALRLIPGQIKTLEELKLPPIFSDFINYSQGLVLITGPTGEGKSTTLAALIDQINTTRAEHIVTIEDPIEFVFSPKKSIISQREINADTHDWHLALRSALREDPNIVLVGEMRDFETIASTLTIAETGHLVFATLHTTTAAQTIDRIIDVFPAAQQNQVRQQLAATLQAVISQRLVPQISGERIVATEIMVVLPSVRNLIREEKTYQIDNVIQTSAEYGMMLIETSLQQLVQRGAVSKEVAMMHAFRPAELERMLQGM
ncbi:MAG: type IV pili twitching motility protein PilT [Candidatus Pacebacteria bacterium CG10_big_fil_rev_8_21_14_0_10_56_10]|nr:MAG: type IV pili twitching motility protein PilT [Candidatus Pacebacteria bacterium CG10_big_fil_rev_8_21_14_0_10_56_10]